jgi:hypothetical protein
MEVDEVPDEGNTITFLKEDTVMMIYDGRPSPGMCRVSNPSLGTPAHWGGAGTRGRNDTSFFISLYINTYRNIDIYITYMPKAKKVAGG